MAAAVDQAVRDLVLGESVGEAPVRAVKLVLDSHRPRLVAGEKVPLGSSLKDDFEKVVGLLGEAEPCVVLVRLKEDKDSDLVAITWVPQAAAGKAALWTANTQQVIQFMQPSRVRELNASSKGEVSLSAFLTAPSPEATDERSTLGVWPLDEHNRKLLDNVHPSSWSNPEKGKDFVYDLIAIGAGAAGLVSAKQSARRGAKSALIECHLAGGDCLNVGCVPSKALLRCARASAERRRGDLGMPALRDTGISFPAVMERLRRLRAHISPVDAHTGTVEAGADVYQGKARFTGQHELEVCGQTLKFKKAVICAGGRARLPPVPGLAEAPYLTNATLFNLTELPPRFVVLGGGPIGLEMAQSFNRFGSKVTVLEGSDRVLGPADPDASAIISKVFREEEIELLTSVKVQSVAHTASKPWPEIRISIELPDGQKKEIVTEAFLVATGRVPNVEGLGLEAAGVEFSNYGVKVNDDLTTTNPDILAVGDVTDRAEFKFTHTAGTLAGMAVQTALFPGEDLPGNAPSRKLSDVVVPRCTFTEPEVASCGISSLREAKAKNVEVDVYSSKMDDNDRAILEGSGEGFVKILCEKGTDRILGATVVAERAGEMLGELTLAAQNGIGMAAVGRTVHPYPTMGEAIQQCALAYNRAHWRKLE